MTNPFRSLSDLTQTLGITLPFPRDAWTLIDNPKTGEVHGIPTARGKLIATNGLIAVLLQPGNRKMMIHPQHFEPDRMPSTPKEPKQSSKVKRVTRIVREYV